MKSLSALAAILALSLAAFAETPDRKPLTAQQAVDALTDADLAQFLPLLKENYIDPKKLGDADVSRATVQGLLDRLAPGAAILQTSDASTPIAVPFRSDMIDGRAGYVRIGSLTPANVAELDTALQKFGGKQAAVILDLRATPPGSEFDQAAEVCKRFCPKGKVLFTLKRPNAKEERILTSRDEPRFHGLLAVLVDPNTAGAAEVIAAVLRTHAKAMIIGQTTKGEAAEFADIALPSGKFVLHIAVGEVALPENVVVFPGGVKPDLAVEVPQETTDAVLQAELEHGLHDLVTETERARMNEAALVSGTNPELDAFQGTGKRSDKSKPPLRDTVLQRALDFITAVTLYEKSTGTK